MFIEAIFAINSMNYHGERARINPVRSYSELGITEGVQGWEDEGWLSLWSLQFVGNINKGNRNPV